MCMRKEYMTNYMELDRVFLTKRFKGLKKGTPGYVIVSYDDECEISFEDKDGNEIAREIVPMKYLELDYKS